MKYIAAPGAPFPKKMAQPIGEYVYEILPKRLGHAPSTDELVAAARRDVKCPYRNYVQWDIKKAALMQWRVQVRTIASHVMYWETIADERITIRAGHNVKLHPEDIARYASTADIKRNPYALEQIVNEARRELEYWSMRYRQYSRLDKPRRYVRKALKEMKKEKVRQ